jgi:hypothetical protein
MKKGVTGQDNPGMEKVLELKTRIGAIILYVELRSVSFFNAIFKISAINLIKYQRHV